VRKGKHKKPLSTANRVLILLGVSLAAFVLVMVVTFWVKGSVPDSLIDKVLDFGQWEAGFLAAIKVAKTVKGEKPGSE
jgi:hypothetical protein